MLNRPIGDPNCQIIHGGRGQYDASVFSIMSEAGSTLILDDRALYAVEIPLTEFWKKKYPEFDWYIIAQTLTLAEQVTGADR